MVLAHTCIPIFTCALSNKTRRFITSSRSKSDKASTQALSNRLRVLWETLLLQLHKPGFLLQTVASYSGGNYTAKAQRCTHGSAEPVCGTTLSTTPPSKTQPQQLEFWVMNAYDHKP